MTFEEWRSGFEFGKPPSDLEAFNAGRTSLLAQLQGDEMVERVNNAITWAIQANNQDMTKHVITTIQQALGE